MNLPNNRSTVLGILLSTIPLIAMAVPNQGGHLVLTKADIVYTSGGEYCISGQASCSANDVQADLGETTVLVVTADFSDSPYFPDMAGLTFGLSYDDNLITIVDYGYCNADFEISTSSWPDPESGTALIFDPPRDSNTVPVYWFVAQGYYFQSTLSLVGHPEFGATFATSSVPAEIAEIHPNSLGRFGFGPATKIEGYCPTAPDDVSLDLALVLQENAGDPECAADEFCKELQFSVSNKSLVFHSDSTSILVARRNHNLSPVTEDSHFWIAIPPLEPNTTYVHLERMFMFSGEGRPADASSSISVSETVNPDETILGG